MRENLETYLIGCDQTGGFDTHVPFHVEAAYRRYLNCGILAHGFARAYCGSFDPDGVIVSWTWEFGDGQTGTGVAPTHTYADDGEYDDVLCVTDNDGEVSCCSPGLPAVPIEGTSWGTLKANFR